MGLVLGANGLLAMDGTNKKARRASVDTKVIYGEDNRQDLYQVTNAMHLDLADSTVALVKSYDVTDMGNGNFSLRGKSFADQYNLCPSEPFRTQQSAAFCSGFLVNEDTIVTAGHCVRSAADCAGTKFVFGFAIRDASGTIPMNHAADQVYSCQSVVRTEQVNSGADFAVIKLDRRVMNHRPLVLRHEGAAVVGDPLVVIGHPSGLPTKVSPGARVRSIQPAYLVANLDTYGGNSGSAVFNDQDGKVEGILVRGERDFIPQGSCTVSNRCASDACRGEDVTKISAVLPFLN